jgi:hypothetical protein
VPRVGSVSLLAPAWSRSFISVPHGQLLVVTSSSRLRHSFISAPRGKLLVISSRVEQLVLRYVPRGQLLIIGPRVGLISHLEQLVANVPRGQLLVVGSRVGRLVCGCPAWMASRG